MMKKGKFKKLAAIACSAALAGVLAFSFSACGDGNDNDNKGNDNDNTNSTQDALSLNKSTATVKVGETTTVTATSSNGSITWTSSDESVATVSASGPNNKICTITGVKAGTATIKAKDGDNEKTCTVTVEAAQQGGEETTETVTIDGAATQYIYGTDGTLTLSATASEGSEITWESSATSVATVEGGVVTAVAAGETTITAKVSDDIKATVTVKVLTDGTAINSSTATNGWIYWDGYQYDGCGDGRVSSANYYASEGLTAITFSCNTTDVPYTVQLKYNNEEYTGIPHNVTLTVISPVEGTIHVNDKDVPVVVGENPITVENNYSDNALYVQFGGKWSETPAITGTDVTFAFKDIQFTSNVSATLVAPSSFSIAEDNKITITDETNTVAGVKYVAGFFANATATEPVTSVPVVSGEEIDLSGVDAATYTVRIKAVSDEATVVDSGWSEATATITVENENTNLKDNSTVPAGSWVYFSQSGAGAFDKAYVDSNEDIHVTDFAGSGDWWTFQLIYKAEAGKTLTGISFTITSDHAGSITAAKDGTQNNNPSAIYVLTETEEGSGVYSCNVPISGMSVSGDETFVIWFCGYGDTSTRLSGNVTVSNIVYTYAE